MADPSSLLTAAQNIASGLSNIVQTLLNVSGQTGYPAISAATVVRSGRGRVAVVSITTAGSTNGVIYDSNSTSVTTAPIYAIPNTIGVVVLNFPVETGIVVIPGTGQVVAVSYSVA